jgi:UDP-N-acetylmuramyl pentapeptide phosphotransferase/UDP-N-acetylglucosamine-1-phosphate transferase
MEGHDTVARLLVLGVVASVISFIGVVTLSRWALALGLVDVPNRRSSHVHPTPRGGGFPLMLTVLIGLIGLSIAGWMSVPPAVVALCVGAFLVAVVSFADDLWRLRPAVRFVAHVAGCLVLVAGGGALDSVQVSDSQVWPTGWLRLPLTFLWVIGLTNAYNFMDGIDGLAAAQAIVTALTMGWLAYLLGNQLVAIFMLLLASATLGFLVLNWPPAKIFLGDVGSAFLGFTFAGWAVLAGDSQGGGPPFLAWIAVLSPFVLDTAVTLACRIARRERWFEAHREHYYQRLVRRGWGHARVTGLYVAMSALCGSAAVLCYGYHLVSTIAVLSLTILLFGLLVLLVRTVERRTAPASAGDCSRAT